MRIAYKHPRLLRKQTNSSAKFEHLQVSVMKTKISARKFFHLQHARSPMVESWQRSYPIIILCQRKMRFCVFHFPTPKPEKIAKTGIRTSPSIAIKYVVTLRKPQYPKMTTSKPASLVNFDQNTARWFSIPIINTNSLPASAIVNHQRRRNCKTNQYLPSSGGNMPI